MLWLTLYLSCVIIRGQDCFTKMLSNKITGRLIRGFCTKYKRYISLHNDAIYLGQRMNLCIQTKSTVTSTVSYRTRAIEDGIFDSLRVHPATSAALATDLYGIHDSRDKGKEAKKDEVTKQKNTQEELTSVKERDILDLRKLLFTENRDYLIQCDGNQLKAEQLAGKVIVIYFMYLPLDDISDCKEWRKTEILKDVYNYLQPNKGFEIVFVAVDDVDNSFGKEMLSDPLPRTNLEDHFEDVFSFMPWTAIPFSDRTSRKRMDTRFGFRKGYCRDDMFVIDSAGVVLQTDALSCFKSYGSLGYPFSSERVEYLLSEWKAIAAQPTLEKLLSSPERDYVISNNGEKVPIYTLEDKVVALYLYADNNTTETNRLTEELKMAYKELAKREENFEVVLLYLYDTNETTGYRTEESFWKTFKTMPWLALPYKDLNLKKLKKIYQYPEYCESSEKEVSLLVIIGPHGEFCEPCGAEILSNYKLLGYPFTREKALKLETEIIKKLKLEMIWEPKTIFSRKDGTHVSLSQLAGKRIILLFGLFQDEFLNVLKERFLDMKGTDGEFEVIHIYTPDEEVDLDPAWLAYILPEGFAYASNILPCEFDKRFLKSGRFYNVGDSTRLLAFNRDGMVVRDTAFPTIDDTNFPFYTMGLENEALLQLNSVFQWYCLGYDDSSSCQAGYVGPNQRCTVPVSFKSSTINTYFLWNDDDDDESCSGGLMAETYDGRRLL